MGMFDTQPPQLMLSVHSQKVAKRLISCSTTCPLKLSRWKWLLYWDGTLLMPNISQAISIIERKMLRNASSADDLDSDMDTTY